MMSSLLKPIKEVVNNTLGASVEPTVNVELWAVGGDTGDRLLRDGGVKTMLGKNNINSSSLPGSSYDKNGFFINAPLLVILKIYPIFKGLSILKRTENDRKGDFFLRPF